MGIVEPIDLKLVEHEEGPGYQAAKCSGVVPVQTITKIEDGKDAEDGESDDFLNHLELVRGEGLGADAVGWNLQAIFKERNRPTNKNDFP